MTRFDIFGVGLLLGSVILCVFGFSKLQSNTEDVLQWLPDKSQARQEYNEFERKFGSDDFLIATWNDCTVEDPRLGQFCRQLTENDADGLIQSVFNGADIIKMLKSDFRFSKNESIERFKGIYFGIQDPNQTLALIELSKKGSAKRKESLRQIEQVITTVPDLELDEVMFGGYPYVGVNVDNQLRNSFQYLLLPSVLLATLVSLCCLRNVLLSMIVFFSAFGAAACSIAIVPVFGIKVSGLMAIIPQCGPAMFHTTSIGAAGLGVYGFSDMPVVRNFCLAITAMLILALLADIFFLPAILAFAGRNTKSKD